MFFPNISSMWFKVNLLLFFVLINTISSDNNGGFTFNGNLNLGGVAEVSPNGLFTLTNQSTFGMGHAFYSSPLSFKNSSSYNGKSLSFSTTFVFALVPAGTLGIGHGMAFLLSPTKEMAGALPAQYLGLFNSTNDGDPSNHIVAIEFDTFRNEEFGDIDGNHVGIDVNGLRSVQSAPAAYFSDDRNGKSLRNLSLASGDKMQVWIDYDSIEEKLNVTLSPLGVIKPKTPLLSYNFDISSVILDQMYVGFSSSNGQLVQLAYVLGWSFKLNGQAPELDLSNLPPLPNQKNKERSNKQKIVLAAVLSVTGLALIISFGTFILLPKRAKFAEIVEDWELKYGPYRFRYKDLYSATKGFDEKKLLGKGGFGHVYEGELNSSNVKVAVKRISHGSKQGMKEFIAEIATIGRLRHPNIMRLLGYCRLKEELLLVYDYMPNSSLDKFVFKTKLQSKTLTWEQRFKVIKQVASGLAYLHEEWIEVIVHRDIKASNVLLDGELNAKLGDFGLARCINHAGQDPQTTNLAGTLGYIAPELARNGKATTSTDVFAFGAFCLEVACGRRPVEARALPDQVILVDWVLECWKKGETLETLDSELVTNDDCLVEEMELVLHIGLICSHPLAVMRPRISQVVAYLNGQDLLPENFEDRLLARERSRKATEFDSSHVSELCDSRSSLTVSESLITIGR